APDPFRAASILSAAWWMYPVESNAPRRLSLTSANLHAVVVQPVTRRVWIAGAGGLLAHSDDGGRSWTQDTVMVPAPAPATPLAADSAARPAPRKKPGAATDTPARLTSSDRRGARRTGPSATGPFRLASARQAVPVRAVGAPTVSAATAAEVRPLVPLRAALR